MKLLVCVSKTPDTTSKIGFVNNGQEFDTAGIQYIMNPYDEWYALVRALELKEALGGSVTIINVGTADNDTVIRKGLAIGADDAVRIDADPKSAMFAAKQIAEFAKNENYDIVFLGKETIDYNGAEIGSMIAEYLDMPFISYATSLNLNGTTASISRDIEGGEEELEVDLPIVVSAAKGMAEQRIPNMRGIMMAKTKPLKVVPPVAFDDMAVTVSYTTPPEKTSVKLVDPSNMEELVRLLHEEAKVI
ncbi:MAG TPA: electron transfer flavoprotein subunit beta/FixA family protein [Saprospiraceae bacterium]|nr:electron transfer flavoprotein subunit beta/FixA family protein [Saprospiraceae bacterium]HRJ14726.1 electron transfer flavoprotein subunit beta/FixA family protein [Saprospiraceae bacterium]HRK79938.1 electron transfer flavoprotein subunit beta/FixA family protein [Saprospiraceae bacterium]